MRLVHASDLHDCGMHLPSADLYVITGDCCPDFVQWSIRKRHHIDREISAEKQSEWAKTANFKQYLGSPEAPVLCVRGNHDFISAAEYLQGCNVVHEFIDNEVVECLGLRVSGHRGVPPISNTWADETPTSELKDRMRRVPEGIDLLLTHYPPAGILDYNTWGLEGMGDFLLYRVGLRLHCFGHIHEDGGKTKRIGSLLFSNAACQFNVIDL